MDYLLIFAKYPEPGRVKTRLAAELGNEKAASVYSEMLHRVVRQTIPKNQSYQQVLCYDPIEKSSEFAKLFPEIKDQIPQQGTTLGDRMSHAIGEVYQSKPAHRVLVIGSDCLEIDESLIEEALQQLNQNDLVLGPAEDGGYYLIGMKYYCPRLFRDISWSTSEVLGKTIGIAESLDLKTKLLKPLSDIDTIKDYRACSLYFHESTK